jgi:hypothetical protein
MVSLPLEPAPASQLNVEMLPDGYRIELIDRG